MRMRMSRVCMVSPSDREDCFFANRQPRFRRRRQRHFRQDGLSIGCDRGSRVNSQRRSRSRDFDLWNWVSMSKDVQASNVLTPPLFCTRPPRLAFARLRTVVAQARRRYLRQQGPWHSSGHRTRFLFRRTINPFQRCSHSDNGTTCDRTGIGETAGKRMVDVSL